jgi:WD40 repeat protein
MSVDCVAISQDGRRIVSGGGRGGTGASFGTGDPNAVRVWDADSGQEVLNLSGHTNAVGGVAISPDGMRIVSFGVRDQSVRLWDATPRASDPK